MEKIKEVINKFKNLEKSKKDKIIIISFVLFVIFTISINILFFNKEKESKKSSFKKESKYILEDEEKNHNNENRDKIYIHIVGAVKNEGVVTLKNTDRIKDVIDKAGGLKENANIKYINLAKVVEDGEKIYIPTNEDIEKLDKQGINSSNFVDGKEGFNSYNNSKSENKKIVLNTAGKEELKTISGIGDSTANKIIEYRNKNGKFKKLEDLKNVEGISDVKYSKIKDFFVLN